MSPFVSVLETYPHHFTGGISSTFFNQEDEGDFPHEIDKVKEVMNIPRPELKVGDIAYWVERANYGYGRYDGFWVKYGIVDEVWKDCYVVNYLVPYEEVIITIDNESHTFKTFAEMQDFINNMSYRKLPKGWTYNTKLFTWRTVNPIKAEGSVKNPEDVKKAVECGSLVRPRMKVTNAGFPNDIVEKQGWKLRMNATSGRNGSNTYIQSDIPLDKYYTFSTWEDAEKLAKILKEEKEWSANLTDSEYVETRILRVLNKAQEKIFGENALTVDEAKRIYNFMIKQKRFDEIECRWYGGFQWRYYDSKKWYTVNPDTLYDDGTKR